MVIYNIRTGQNTVLRGLLAEEFAKYILVKRFPLLIIRPNAVLRFLEEIPRGKVIQFILEFQQTMDYLGIGPVQEEDLIHLTQEYIVKRFFSVKEGLTRYLLEDHWAKQLRGFVIEVKSRTEMNSRVPFHYSFSPKQERMLKKIKDVDLEVILCGVTFQDNWNIAVTFTNERGKILAEDFLIIDQ
jgi:hypothetical protein